METIIHYDRIRRFTPARVNERIDSATRSRVEELIRRGPDAVRARLEELDREWDIDRVLMLNFSVLVFAQLVAARRNRRWLWGPLVQTPFLFLHATMGWCPPMLWFRPLGFRSKREIHAEREALRERMHEEKRVA
jgi:hypothetical protein